MCEISENSKFIFSEFCKNAFNNSINFNVTVAFFETSLIKMILERMVIQSLIGSTKKLQIIFPPFAGISQNSIDFTNSLKFAAIYYSTPALGRVAEILRNSTVYIF